MEYHMGMSNKELVQKATIVANDLASAGKLNPAQSDRFLQYVFDESVLTSFARIEKFRNEQMYIEKIGVGQRVALPKAEAVDPGRRRGVTTSRVTLDPKEIMVPSEIGDNFKEYNIEGESVETTILQMFARQLNNDVEELYINGDTNGILQIEGDIYPGGSSSLYVNDSFLALFNGFLKKAQSGNVVDFAGGNISASMYRQALSAMPTKFKRNKKELKFLVPYELDELWRERVASRATGMGDQALNSQGNLTPFGIEQIPVPLMPMYPLRAETLTFTGAASTLNLAYGPIQAGSVVVVNEAEAATGQPRASYVEDTDFTVDEAAGTITHIGAAGIGNTEEVRVTYRSMPQIILTTRQNTIIAIGRDVTMERDRDIYRGVDQFATTVKVDCQFEENTAVVTVNNISDNLS